MALLGTVALSAKRRKQYKYLPVVFGNRNTVSNIYFLFIGVIFHIYFYLFAFTTRIVCNKASYIYNINYYSDILFTLQYFVYFEACYSLRSY